MAVIMLNDRAMEALMHDTSDYLIPMETVIAHRLHPVICIIITSSYGLNHTLLLLIYDQSVCPFSLRHDTINYFGIYSCY